MSLSPFLVAYGGGHAQIIRMVYAALRKRGDSPTILGLTTGFAALRRSGLPVNSVEALVRPEEDRPYLEMALEFIDGDGHPDITQEQTQAYFGLGFRDLVRKIGPDAAREEFKLQGRKAFLPIEVFRRHFRETRPDIVVATTSPRFELAALRAAKAEGIPALAIGDLFLEKEREWIMSGEYADELAVLSHHVAESLVEDGFDAQRLKITGNPAFDALEQSPEDMSRRAALRASWKIEDRCLILCPTASAARSMNGQYFMSPQVLSRALEALCASREDLTYMMRPHPNAPFDLPADCPNGLIDTEGRLSAEEAILMSDIMLVEASTMGFQAALTGKKVICVGFADYVKYPNMGLAMSVDTVDEACNLIATGSVDPPNLDGFVPPGQATGNVLNVIDELVTDRLELQKGKCNDR